MKKAHFLGKYQGKRIHRYHVAVSHFSLEHGTRVLLSMGIDAPSHSDALWHARYTPEFTALATRLKEPLTIATRGPQGGVREHFLGWESLIGFLIQQRPAVQAERLF